MFLATRGTGRGAGASLRAEQEAETPANAPPPADLSGSGVCDMPSTPLTSFYDYERTATSPAAAPTPAGTVRLRGTVVVHDPQGAPHAAESGFFVLIVWAKEEERQEAEVQVAEGAFTVDVQAEAELSVGTMQLGGRRAFHVPGRPATQEPFEVPQEGVLELVARWPPRTLLHVRAQADGRALDGIEVVSSSGWPDSDLAHPGHPDGGQFLARDATSPVDLTGTQTWDGVVYARAPGYAWGRTTLDLDQGGERFVALEPAAALEVELVGWEPGTDGRLRLRAEGDEEPTAELGLRERVGIESLCPRRYRVSAEIGEFWADPIVLGGIDVDLRAGETQRVTLELAPAPHAELVPLAGIVVVPSAWELDGFTLHAKLLDTPLQPELERHDQRSGAMQRAATDSWSFAFPAVQPGRYELTVAEAAFSVGLDVPAGGVTDVLFAVPPPTHVAVRAVEAESGREAELLTLHWYAVRPDGVTGGVLESVQRDPESRLFEFRAPQTPIVLHCWEQAYCFVNETVELHAGRNEITLEFSPSCGIVLSFHDGENQLPWEGDWMVYPQGVEEDGAATGWSQDGRTLRIMLSKPGLYRFDVPEVPGYEPLPPQEVWVAAGEFVEHRLALVRRP